MILRPIPSASFKFFCWRYSHLTGIHQLSEAHPQRTIQYAVMSPYIFPTWKGTVLFTSFHFLESIAYSV